MNNKNVLITGCATGIGLNLAQTLQNKGYKVFASVRKQSDVEKLTQLGLRCLLLDVADSESIQSACKHLLKETDGNLYALINNAGFGQPGAVEDLNRTVLREQFETNLFGLVELTNLLLPSMHQQGYGRIIQISSVLGFVAMPFRGAYIASKFALEGISDTLRLELQGTNIHVSLIEPGPITSRFRENSLKLFNKNIDSNNSRFRKSYEATIARLETEGPAVPFTLEPEAVSNKVLDALQNTNPKSRYYVTFPTYLFAYLKRILPTSMLDNLLSRSSKIEEK
ncbi:MAG: SDR family NAD(P)-dependent oxidoreductase [Gammaproteobacteria bacterium]